MCEIDVNFSTSVNFFLSKCSPVARIQPFFRFGLNFSSYFETLAVSSYFEFLAKGLKLIAVYIVNSMSGGKSFG